MNIHIAAQYLKVGYRIKRASWSPGKWIDNLDPELDSYRLLDNLLATDWEVVIEDIVQEFPEILYSDQVLES